MVSNELLRHVLNDDALTRGLADPEARYLVEWLVAQVERIEDADFETDVALSDVHRLCRKGRSIGRFVSLWCHRRTRSAALQLASTERFNWPLPTTDMDPYDLMQTILSWESTSRTAA